MKEIRTLGFYQPFCSLMLHGKKETRWVKKGKKPPFPLGEYLFYSTKKSCGSFELFEWSGSELMLYITSTLINDETRKLNGYALATGNLVSIRPMVKEDEAAAFVKFVGTRTRLDKNEMIYEQVQWILEFENVTAIEPFEFKEGKQGVGKFMLNKEPNPERSVARDDS